MPVLDFSSRVINFLMKAGNFVYSVIPSFPWQWGCNWIESNVPVYVTSLVSLHLTYHSHRALVSTALQAARLDLCLSNQGGGNIPFITQHLKKQNLRTPSVCTDKHLTALSASLHVKALRLLKPRRPVNRASNSQVLSRKLA